MYDFTETAVAIESGQTQLAMQLLEQQQLKLVGRFNEEDYVQLLYIAICADNNAIVNLLLKIRAVPEFLFQKLFSYTPIGLALAKNNDDLANLLSKKTDKNFALYVATKFQRWDTVNKLKSMGFYKSRLAKILFGLIKSSA